MWIYPNCNALYTCGAKQVQKNNTFCEGFIAFQGSGIKVSLGQDVKLTYKIVHIRKVWDSEKI